MNGAADNKHLSRLTCVCVRKREKLPCDLFKRFICLCPSLRAYCPWTLPERAFLHQIIAHISHLLWCILFFEEHSPTLLSSLEHNQGTYDSMNFVTRSRRWKTGDDFSVAAACSPDFFFFFSFILMINLNALTVRERVHFCQNPPSGGSILWPVGGSLLWGPQFLSGKGLGLCQILPPAPQVK